MHNLGSGGARRRLLNQVALLPHECVEVCLGTATPISDSARVIAWRPAAPRLPRPARIPVRYLDLLTLAAAWQRAAGVVRGLGADVVFAGPCRYLQSPPMLGAAGLPPSLYFCDEPRRVDYEDDAKSSRNPTTRHVYAALHEAQRRLDRRGAMAADLIATNSRYTAEAIRAAYGREAEPVVLGVAPEFAQTPPGAPRHLLSVGTLIPSKGHDLVIRAAARTARRWPVVIVGTRGQDGERERLQELADEEGVELDVRQGISDDELRRAYADAFATLYLARREPLGLASIEAQACGCPVIVADEGGLPETIDEGRSGWAVPRDAAVVAARVDALSDAGRTAMQDACRHSAQRWSWKRSAEHIDELLGRAVTQRA